MRTYACGRQAGGGGAEKEPRRCQENQQPFKSLVEVNLVTRMETQASNPNVQMWWGFFSSFLSSQSYIPPLIGPFGLKLMGDFVSTVSPVNQTLMLDVLGFLS